MANLTNKELDFLSNQELITILRSILDEIDIVASSGAHRSTTYLAVSAIEGLFGELFDLLEPQPIEGIWPEDGNGKYRKLDALTLEQKEKILKAAGALPPNFENLYTPVRVFRNYVHPERELKNQTPIHQSVAQLAVACLNALIEKYEHLRFAAGHQWELVYGLAQVPTDNVIHMPQNPGEFASLLVTNVPADCFREIRFRVIISRDSIFNFVYNYFSLNQFMGARIEGRVTEQGGGYDNGRLICKKWRAWSISYKYTKNSEPNPRQQEHSVRVVLDSSENFALIVDGVHLELEDGRSWEFDPQGKIGFMTEHGNVSVIDLEIQAR